MKAIGRRNAIAGLSAAMALGKADMTLAASSDFAPVAALLDKIVSEGIVAGAAVSVARRGETLFARSRGLASLESRRPLEPDAIWRIYSMSKPIAACAVLLLADDGVLTLDDPVARWIPEFSDMRVVGQRPEDSATTARARTMTVRHLLTHTSGLTNSWNGDAVSPLYLEAGLAARTCFHDPAIHGLDDYASRLGRLPLAYQPGTQWKYSISPDIAGLVVQRAAGRPFGAFLRERLFDPLGMSDTGFHVPEDKSHRLADVYARDAKGGLVLKEAAEGSPFLRAPSVESGAAGLVSTLADYTRFAQMIANGGRGGGRAVLSEAAIGELCASQVPAQVLGRSLVAFASLGSGSAGEGLGMGLCGSVVLDPAASGLPGHVGDYSWGGAASTTFVASPASGLSIVFMTQLWPSGSYRFLDWLKIAVHDAAG